jgi:hypothetical protein
MSKVLSINVPVLVDDGVVDLFPEVNGAIVVSGSNATAYAAHYSARAGVRAAIHHDCGIGRDEAGGSGLLLGGPAWYGYGGRSDGQRPSGRRRRHVAPRNHQSRQQTCGYMWRLNGLTVEQAVELLKSALWPHAVVDADTGDYLGGE